MLSLTDAHIHLQDASYDCDRQAVIERAGEVGVRRFLCAGISPADSPALKQLALDYPQVAAGYGVHPWYVDNLPQDWPALLEGFLDSAAFVGEIGLDRQLAKTDFSLQLDIFKAQLAIAAGLNKPAVLHCLKSHNELLETLTAQKNMPAFILHSYSGSRDMIKNFERLGGYFSFGSSVFREGCKAVKCVKEVPLERLLIETDSPFMPPAGIQRNEPANLELIVRRIAELRQMTPETLSEQIEQNIISAGL